jgi:hypothetical protein
MGEDVGQETDTVIASVNDPLGKNIENLTPISSAGCVMSRKTYLKMSPDHRRMP